MLRISVTNAGDATTVSLEGRLAGAWVEEVARSWSSVAAGRDGRRIRVDLDAVSYVDRAGKALLRSMHEQGAVLTATRCMTRAIVDEIRGTATGP